MSLDNLDKEIQEAIDNNPIEDSVNKDYQAYIALYDLLKQPSSEEYLPSSFADTIVSKVALEKRDSEAFWWLGATILFMIITCMIVTLMTLNILNIQVSTFITKYSPMMGLLMTIIVVVQYFDKKVMKFHI